MDDTTSAGQVHERRPVNLTPATLAALRRLGLL